MDLSFSDKIVEAGVFSISKSEFNATLEAIKMFLERGVAEMMAAISSSLLLPDFEVILVRNARDVRQNESELECPFSGRFYTFCKAGNFSVQVFVHLKFGSL